MLLNSSRTIRSEPLQFRTENDKTLLLSVKIDRQNGFILNLCPGFRFGLTKDQVRGLLPIINTQNTDISLFCPKELKSYPGNDCGDGIEFRSIDGRCNNFVHPHWGAAKLPFKRLLPSDYGDGEFAVCVLS